MSALANVAHTGTERGAAYLDLAAEKRKNGHGGKLQGIALEPWPTPLDKSAFHGLAGEIVREIEPQTESDSAALLMQVLVSFGALVGRGPHVTVEGDQHHSNLFVLIVGDTAKARKGTSWGRILEIFGKAERWPRTVEGLSSGEGLKWNVRDGKDKDAGIEDKRILIVESEFAQVLRQVARAGNTLSATIRAAWDKGDLATLTRNDPITATGAHICIIGHITSDELRSELTATDSANGFANRFIFQCVKRSKSLAFGGRPMPPETVHGFASRIARAAGQARIRGAVEMGQDAREVWAAVYPTLSEGYSGLFGAVTARAEAQCLRLALLFALMDEAQEIGRAHILAALAVWERAQASARHIFGSALGDPIADEILRSLKAAGPVGMSRTEISRTFSGHKSAERIGAALDLMQRRGLAYSELRQTAGAPSEVWLCA